MEIILRMNHWLIEVKVVKAENKGLRDGAVRNCGAGAVNRAVKSCLVEYMESQELKMESICRP